MQLSPPNESFRRSGHDREQCRVDREHFSLLELLYGCSMRGLLLLDTGVPSLESAIAAVPAWFDIRVGTHKSEGTTR
jgi:hypothetical protein